MQPAARGCSNALRGPATRSEEAQLVLVERDEHILGLAVVVEHHLVRLAAEAALLVLLPCARFKPDLWLYCYLHDHAQPGP